MKHIKKKYLIQKDLPKDTTEILSKAGTIIPIKKDTKFKKLPKGANAYAIYDEYMIKSFQYKYQGTTKLIPEPDPILIYFNAAYKNYREAEKIKAELFKIIEANMTEDGTNHLYDFFESTSGFVIFLFTALEAFVNKLIPENYKYERVLKSKTEIFNKTQIEESTKLLEKIEIILVQITGKDFKNKFPIKYDHITNLKDYRNNIVHTQQLQGEELSYAHLFKRSFTFRFEETINSIKDFLNFYAESPNYIEDCPCSFDW